MYWLIAQSVRQLIEQAQLAGALPSVEQQADYEARYGFDGADGSRVLTVAGDVAEVSITGAITKTPSLMAMLFGGGNTTYAEINAALAAADKDADVKRIELRVDSPGGMFDGLFDTLAAIGSVSKPVRAVVDNRAASAAYAIVSQADEIVAANRAAQFGSIGVVASFGVSAERVDVSSTLSPKKRPDVSTSDGQAVVREELDALHEIFVDAIADGRGASTNTVNTDYGQGAQLLAEEALKRGMIDSIAETPLRVVKSTQSNITADAGGATTPRSVNMDITKLKAEHPETYAAAVAVGQDEERDRVVAHLTMGEASGDMKTATAAVKDGTGMTATLTAQYNAAALNRGDQSNRAADDPAASVGGDTSADSEDSSGEVMAIIEQRFGIEG